MFHKKKTQKLDTKIILSTLWIIILFNMAFADILSLYIPDIHEELNKFSSESGMSIPQLMLMGAIIHQIPIFMIFLSRILKYKINRWTNIVTSIITIIYIIGGGSFLPHYIFIASVEVLCLLALLFVAFRWQEK